MFGDILKCLGPPKVGAGAMWGPGATGWEVLVYTFSAAESQNLS